VEVEIKAKILGINLQTTVTNEERERFGSLWYAMSDMRFDRDVEDAGLDYGDSWQHLISKVKVYYAEKSK
jgi:hypothetical protein